MTPTIAVVGSMNIDLVTYTSRVPAAGETIIGERFQMGFGGKGANQAVMARLMGADVAMIGCLGDDTYAEMTKENFASFGIDTTHVHTVPGSSGVAPIWVEPDGTNRIIVVPGANNQLTAHQAIVAIQSYSDLAVVIGQFEVPQQVTAAAFEEAKRHGIPTVLNPAPATSLLPGLLAASDWLIPNESEFGLLGGGNPTDDNALVEFADEAGTRLLITLGKAGTALVTMGGEVLRFPSQIVEAVDTTGAGDAFVGVFAYGLAAGLEESMAVRLGMACATDSVTRPGTQSSFPHPERCQELLIKVG